ncbi:MAG TPA: bifunctional phosphoglucose/phosphomannose isomerase [Acidobacteriota bacterium]|nr:bifunctional phosphoglucose/phosphomannose isomerase [Acidobacteriota bacterium]
MEFNYDNDKSDFRQVLMDFPTQIDRANGLTEYIKVDQKVTKIAIIGMGGSALPGLILQNYLKDEHFPVYVIRDFNVPNYIDKETLIFIISYSGNTDETIAAYRKVVKHNAPIITMSAGGKLEQIASMYKSQYVRIPQVLQPRLAIGYMFFAIINILVKAKIIQDRSEDTKATIKALQKDVYEPFAKDLANKIGDKTPLMYASTDLSSITYLWKIGFNENAKSMAFANVVPELDHNELAGYAGAKGQYYTILFKDVTGDDPRIRKRIETLKELIKESGNDAAEMAIRGENLMSKLFSAIFLGMWTTYYVALARGVDPAPVDIIESFKQKVK